MKGFGAGPERTWTFVSVLEMVECLGPEWACTRVLGASLLAVHWPARGWRPSVWGREWLCRSGSSHQVLEMWAGVQECQDEWGRACPPLCAISETES